MEVQKMEIVNISKKYGNLTILENVTFTLEQGEIIGLVGKNGVGKSTLMKILVQNNLPTSGTVSGNENVGYLIEEPKIFIHKTGLDNLRYFSSLYGVNYDAERFGKLIKELDLSDFIDKKAKNYSLGTKQKLSLLLTLVTEPNFLVLDEPTNGMDVETSQTVLKFLNNLSSNEHTGILISSHKLEDVESICDKVFFLENGSLILQKIGKNTNRSIFEIEFMTKQDLGLFISKQRFGKIVENNGLKILLTADVQNSTLFKFFNEYSIQVANFESKKETLKDIYLKRLK